MVAAIAHVNRVAYDYSLYLYLCHSKRSSLSFVDSDDDEAVFGSFVAASFAAAVIALSF